MTFEFAVITAFGAGALILGAGSLAVLFAWLPTRRWRRVEALLEQLEITPKAARAVTVPSVNVIARYRYKFDGISHLGHRISVFEVRPRFFQGYNPPMLRGLEADMIQEKTVPIKVDPRHPERAILLDLPVKGHLIAGFGLALVCGTVAAFTTHFDDSPASIAVGWGLASLCFMLSLLFREGWMVLMIFNGI